MKIKLSVDKFCCNSIKLPPQVIQHTGLVSLEGHPPLMTLCFMYDS